MMKGCNLTDEQNAQLDEEHEKYCGNEGPPEEEGKSEMTNKKHYSEEDFQEIAVLAPQKEWDEVYAVSLTEGARIEICFKEKINDYRVKRLATEKEYQFIAKAPQMAAMIKQLLEEVDRWHKQAQKYADKYREHFQQRDEQLENYADAKRGLEGVLRKISDKAKAAVGDDSCRKSECKVVLADISIRAHKALTNGKGG